MTAEVFLSHVNIHRPKVVSFTAQRTLERVFKTCMCYIYAIQNVASQGQDMSRKTKEQIPLGQSPPQYPMTLTHSHGYNWALFGLQLTPSTHSYSNLPANLYLSETGTHTNTA